MNNSRVTGNSPDWHSYKLKKEAKSHKAAANPAPAAAAPKSASAAPQSQSTTASSQGWKKNLDAVFEPSTSDSPAGWGASLSSREATHANTQAIKDATKLPDDASSEAAPAPASAASATTQQAAAPASKTPNFDLGYSGSMVPPNQIYGPENDPHTIDTTKYGPYTYGEAEQAEAKANELNTPDDQKIQSVSASALASGLEKLSEKRYLDDHSSLTREEIQLELQEDRASAKGDKLLTADERKALRMAAQVAGNKLTVDWVTPSRSSQSTTFVDAHAAKNAAKLDGDDSTVTREELQATLYKRPKSASLEESRKAIQDAGGVPAATTYNRAKKVR